MPVGKGQISDEVDGELLKGERGRRLNGGEWRGDRVCASLVLLADGATGDKVVDKHRESQPPEITFNNGLGAKTSKVAREGRRMDRVKQQGTSGWRYIHPILIVKVSIVKSPVSEGRTREKGGIIRQILNGTEYERVGRRR